MYALEVAVWVMIWLVAALLRLGWRRYRKRSPDRLRWDAPQAFIEATGLHKKTPGLLPESSGSSPGEALGCGAQRVGPQQSAALWRWFSGFQAR